MPQAYRRYCKAAAVAFALVTLYTVPTKQLQGRLGHDWAHSVLHLGSAVLTAYAGWLARSATPARVLTWAIGIGYFALGCYGWSTRGLRMPVADGLLDTPPMAAGAAGAATLGPHALPPRRATASSPRRPQEVSQLQRPTDRQPGQQHLA